MLRLLPTAACAALFSLPLQAATVFDYRFEGGPDGAPVTSLVDSGPNGLHGSTRNLSFTDAVAAGGGAFALDARGDLNHAEVPHAAAMAVQSFTFSLLARPDGACFGPSDFCFIATKKLGESGFFLSSYGIYYTREGRFGAEVGYGGDSGRALLSADTYAIGSGWHQVVLTLARDVAGTQDRLSLYVDGVLQASHEGDMPDLRFADVELAIGAANFLNNADSEYRRNFNGAIDNVRLLDVALPPVPEPGTALLLAAGLTLLSRRRPPAPVAPA